MNVAEQLTKADMAVDGLVGLTCISAVLAVGGVHRPVIAAIFGLMSIAAIVTIISSHRSKGTFRISAFGAAFMILASWSALQLIPLPLALLEMLAPATAAILTTSAALIGVDVGSHSISIQPQASAEAALRFATLAMSALTIGNLRDRTLTWRMSVGSVVIAALLSWAVGWGHRVFGVQEYYGYFQAALAPRMTTFVSSNHAASLFGLASLVLLALAWKFVQDDRRQEAVAFVVLGGFLFMGMLEANSAGVLGAYFLAILAFSARQLLDRFQKHSSKILKGTAAIGGLSALIAAFYTPFHQWIFQSFGTRAELNRAALEGSLHSWLVGFGAGATETALPLYVDWTKVGDARLTTIETEPIEWFFTLGWPIAILVIVIMAAYLVPARSDHGSPRREFFGNAVWVTSIYFAVISMLHFPFFALGVSLPAILVIESFQRQVFPRHHGQSKAPRPGSYPYLDIRLGPSIVGFVWLICIGIAGFTLSAPRDTQDIQTEVVRNPADATLFATLSQQALAQKKPVEAEIFARRAVELEPNDRMHLLHAMMLGANKRGEEAVAVYQKISMTPAGARAATEAAAILPPKLAAKAIPNELHWRRARDTAIKVRGKNAGIDFVLALVDEHPKSGMAAQIAIEAYWQRKEYDVAELWARMLMADGRTDEEGNPIGPGLLIQTLLKANRVADARIEATRAMEFVPGDPVVERAVIQLRPVKPADAQKADIDMVAKAHKLYCHSAHIGQERKFCELAHAWLAEATGDLKKAEEVLKGLTERFDTATPLAEFYVRTNQCASLRTLNMSWRDKPDSEKVATMSARCGVL